MSAPPDDENDVRPPTAVAESVPEPITPPEAGSEPSARSSALELPVRRRLAGKRIVLCVTGSIAAYKAAVLLRLLSREGASLEVVISRAATEFVGAATFSGLNRKPVLTDMFEPGRSGELHVDLAANADLILMAPASADLLARLAGGRADDLIAALSLCARCPILVAPAMHPNMWEHPATQRNVQSLMNDRRVAFVGPVHGEVASGELGTGRMAEPETILAFAVAQLTNPKLRGRHIVITAGPTAEDVDPVRYLGNRSSGAMGFALAERAAAHGARVTLIAGPVALPTPPGVRRVDVRSALAMQSALWQALRPDLSLADALIMAAAVADYRPSQVHSAKLKRTEANLNLELIPNPDLLADIGDARKSSLPILVGFALETDDDEGLMRRAREKLVRKKVDLVVANRADESLGLAEVRAMLVTAETCDPLPRLSKEDAADHILSWVANRIRSLRGQS